jgi:redox-sensitive bicupin YhaK (pirin superfamily)
MTPRRTAVQLVTGDVELHGAALAAGDGAALSDEPRLEIVAHAASELLVFDLA